MLKAYQCDYSDVYAAESAEQAAQLWRDMVGEDEPMEDGYPRELSDEELEQVNGGFANSYMVQSIFNNGKVAGYAIRRYSFGAAWLKVFGYNHPSETVLIQGDEAAMKKWLDNRAGQFDSIYIDNKMYRSALI